MKTIKGPSLLLSQFIDAEPRFGTLDGLAAFAADCGFKALQIPTAIPKIFDLAKAAESQAYCDDIRALLAKHGVEVSELSSSRQGQLVAVNPAYDRTIAHFAPESVRGNPDARWRLKPENLANLTATQDAVLEQGAQLTRPGGRLIYVTCSLLPDENEERVKAFLASNGAFKALDATKIWPDVLPGESPLTGPYLTFSPVRTGTDGFFIAILERSQ